MGKYKKIIPLDKLNIYANYFKVNLDYIVKLSDEKEKTKSTKLNKVIIGNNLKQFRKDFNVTQKILARLLNPSHSTISVYESRKTVLLTAFAFQICEEYNISLDSLCGITNDKFINKKEKNNYRLEQLFKM